MLMESIVCFTSPLALAYGFHARRYATRRALAWVGLLFSLLVFVPFVVMMVASVLNLGESMCR